MFTAARRSVAFASQRTAQFSVRASPLTDAQRLIGDAQGLPRSAIARNMNTKVSGTSSHLFFHIPQVFTRFHRARHRH